MTLAAASSRLQDGLARIDALADRRFGEWHVPGLAYGVIADGRLVHARGLGTLRVGEDAPPTPSSVFRIASMTKSFTAATVLHLRDEGRLRLDDPVGQHVPELADLRGPTSDSPLITIRHLLTMTAGFPTDDPWGDRQQGLDLGAFSELLRGGLSFAWAPGIRFEYSNTGYGILGRVITNVAGREYRDVVRERLLAPLSMDSTGYLAEEVEPERLAHGYLWRDEAFVEEPMEGYGALAAMGGLFTTIEDLSRWVIGFLDSTPPRDGPENGHPLSRASRREMQQPMVPGELRLSQSAPDAMPDAETSHYGFGLFQIDTLAFGRMIGHGGGYPGFGSHMRWHPASGLGIVSLANSRYGPAGPLAREQMQELLRLEAAPVRKVRPAAPTEAARAAVERLLGAWDDAEAAELFAMNIELDEPVALRKAAIQRIRERHGALRADDVIPNESLSPFHLDWWLAGARGGRVHVEIQLSPELPPKLQSLALTSVAEPSALQRGVADRLVARINAGTDGAVVDWPGDVALAADVDLAAVRRVLAATAARFAPVSLGPPVDGDGASKATYRLHSDRGHLELALDVDATEACVKSVVITPIQRGLPDLE
ncbi:MAG TPA: serine hydrolase domain-containing protein [Candidatus Limnocylindria bacterium]|nr:serine hydrolase domain-containing protein [Candidatus Limnocylindria bacterium]